MEEELVQVWALNFHNGRPGEGSDVEEEWKRQTKLWIQQQRSSEKSNMKDEDIDALVARIVDRASSLRNESQTKQNSSNESGKPQSQSFSFSLLLGAGVPTFFMWEKVKRDEAPMVHKAMMDLQAWEDVEPDWEEISQFLKAVVLGTNNNHDSLDWSKVYVKWYGMMRSSLSSTISMVADLVKHCFEASFQNLSQSGQTDVWIRLWWFMWMDVHLMAGNKTVHYPVFQQMAESLCHMFLLPNDVNSQSRFILESFWDMDPSCRWLRVWSDATTDSEWLERSNAASVVSRILGNSNDKLNKNTKNPKDAQICFFWTQVILSSTRQLSWMNEAKQALVSLMDKCYLSRSTLLTSNNLEQHEHVAFLCIEAISQWIPRDEIDRYNLSQELKESLRVYSDM